MEGGVGVPHVLMIICFSKWQFLTHAVLKIISRCLYLEVSVKNPVLEKRKRKLHRTIREGIGSTGIYLLCCLPCMFRIMKILLIRWETQNKKTHLFKKPVYLPCLEMALLIRCYEILISSV